MDRTISQSARERRRLGEVSVLPSKAARGQHSNEVRQGMAVPWKCCFYQSVKVLL